MIGCSHAFKKLIPSFFFSIKNFNFSIFVYEKTETNMTKKTINFEQKLENNENGGVLKTTPLR
jgi:hypothetical protein